MPEGGDPGAEFLADDATAREASGTRPIWLTAFIGRQRELDELRSLFANGKRLVSLVGIGGIGKTRLAFEFGFGSADLGWSNVYSAEFAALADPGLVEGAVLEALGCGSSAAPLQAMVDHLREARALLILDCCEHVIDAARHVADVLCRRCPELALLATSRSPLGIDGELVWPVPPLSLHKPTTTGESVPSEAAQLFTDRASNAQSRFELNDEVADVVERIVDGVEGIPLAIELAAARIRVLAPGEIAEGLDDHLRLLRGGRTSDRRHHTIRASLDWSHDLLTDHERLLFARLSVFSGGFDREAATTVCAGASILPDHIIDEIEGLVDKSLLAVDRTTNTTRFWMLDFVRQYASERLIAAGEQRLVTDRHRVYFRTLAERADRELWALDPLGRSRLDAESPNLRAAIDDACVKAPDDALAIVGALGFYWRMRGRKAEGVAATEQSLRASSPEPSSGQARALATLSMQSFWLGDFARTMSAATAALEVGALVGDVRSQALALSQLGSLVILDDPGLGDPMLKRAAELARTAGDDVALSDALASLVISYFFQDDREAMRSPAEEALRVAEEIGYEDGVRWCLWCLAHSDLSAGELASARAHGERALVMLPSDEALSQYCAVEVVSILDANTGAPDAARRRAEADLGPSRQERVRLGTGVLMHALGVAALAQGDLDDAHRWATSLYDQESEVCYLAWHAQEILMTVALAREDSARAKVHVDLLLAAAEPLNNRRARALAQLGLARAVLLDGGDDQAESATHEALRVLMDNGWLPAAVEALDVLAEIALFQAQYERAVRLTAAAQSKRGVLGLVAFPTTQERIRRNLELACRAVGDENFARARDEGARLPLEEAVSYAQRGRGAHASARHGWASLSRVEQQVVKLACKGLSNPDIARELFISRNTVKVHLSHIYAKLAVANRTELARLAASRSHEPGEGQNLYPSG